MTAMSDAAEPLIVGDDTTPHDRGNAQCTACWTDYPKPCECGGLVHAVFGDEWYTDDDSGYWLSTKCDRCGEPE